MRMRMRMRMMMTMMMVVVVVMMRMMMMMMVVVVVVMMRRMMMMVVVVVMMMGVVVVVMMVITIMMLKDEECNIQARVAREPRNIHKPKTETATTLSNQTRRKVGGFNPFISVTSACSAVRRSFGRSPARWSLDWEPAVPSLFVVESPPSRRCHGNSNFFGSKLAKGKTHKFHLPVDFPISVDSSLTV